MKMSCTSCGMEGSTYSECSIPRTPKPPKCTMNWIECLYVLARTSHRAASTWVFLSSCSSDLLVCGAKGDKRLADSTQIRFKSPPACTFLVSASAEKDREFITILVGFRFISLSGGCHSRRVTQTKKGVAIQNYFRDLVVNCY